MERPNGMKPKNINIPVPITTNLSFSPSTKEKSPNNFNQIPKISLSQFIRQSIANSQEEWNETHVPFTHQGQVIEISGNSLTTRELLDRGVIFDNSLKPLFPEFTLAYGKRKTIKVKPNITTLEKFIATPSEASPMVLHNGESVYMVGKRYVLESEEVYLFAFTKDRTGNPKAIINSSSHIPLFSVDLESLEPTRISSPHALYLPPDNCYSTGKKLDVGSSINFDGSTREIRAFVVSQFNESSKVCALLEDCEGKKTVVDIEELN